MSVRRNYVYWNLIGLQYFCSGYKSQYRLATTLSRYAWVWLRQITPMVVTPLVFHISYRLPCLVVSARIRDTDPRKPEGSEIEIARERIWPESDGRSDSRILLLSAHLSHPQHLTKIHLHTHTLLAFPLTSTPDHVSKRNPIKAW